MIRKMTISDYDGVHSLWLGTPGMGLNNIDDSREGISKYLVRNPNTCFVAEKEGVIVGVILSGHDGRRGYIYHLAVALTKRNQGIGRQLVEYAMNALKLEQITKVALVVFSGNEIGNAFWNKLGFAEREDLTYRNKNIKLLQRIDT